MRVIDTEAPSFPNIFGDITVECDNIPGAPSFSISDNCDPAPELVLVESTIAGSCPGNYSLIRTWTATDVCGNENRETQTITVIDTVPPLMNTAPNDITIDCSDVLPAPPTIEADDNCDAAVNVVYTQTILPGTCEGSSIVRREWTTQDSCGYSSSQTQEITLADTTPPDFVGVNDTLIDCDASFPDPAIILAKDDCDSSVDVLYTSTSCESSLPAYQETLDSIIYLMESPDPGVPSSTSAISDLTLSAICNESPTEYRRWELTNPNAFPVYVAWEVVGSATSGGFWAPSGTSYFFSPYTGGIHSVKITWLKPCCCRANFY